MTSFHDFTDRIDGPANEGIDPKMDSKEGRAARNENLNRVAADLKEKMKKVTLAFTVSPQAKHLQNESERLSSEDVQEVINILQNIVAETGEAGAFEHVRITAEYAYRVALALEAQGEIIDPNRVCIQALLHNIGRVMGNHHYMHTEIYGRALLALAGMKHLGVCTVHVGKDYKDFQGDNVDAAHRLSMEEMIIKVVDVWAKRNKDETLFTQEHALGLHTQTRKSVRDYEAYAKLGTLFHSSFKGLREVEERDGEVYTDLYRRLYQHFKDRGIDLNIIRDEILQSETEKAD